VLLYGPPGTGKTLLAKAIASNMDANFLKVVSSAIVDKYIGESARLIREMFGYAKVRCHPILDFYLLKALAATFCSQERCVGTSFQPTRHVGVAWSSYAGYSSSITDRRHVATPI